MGAGAGQGQHQNIVLHPIDQQPVRLDMTLPVSDPITRQGVVAVLLRQRLSHGKAGDHVLQQFNF